MSVEYENRNQTLKVCTFVCFHQMNLVSYATEDSSSLNAQMVARRAAMLCLYTVAVGMPVRTCVLLDVRVPGARDLMITTSVLCLLSVRATIHMIWKIRYVSLVRWFLVVVLTGECSMCSLVRWSLVVVLTGECSMCSLVRWSLVVVLTGECSMCSLVRWSLVVVLTGECSMCSLVRWSLVVVLTGECSMCSLVRWSLVVVLTGEYAMCSC